MKIKISKQKRTIKEEKKPVNEVAPLVAMAGSALSKLAPKIIKGVAGLVGGGDSEKDAAALIDKSQLDPIVIKSQELQAIQQLLQSIEAKISELASSSSTDEMPSPTARDATAKASAPSPASTSEPSKV